MSDLPAAGADKAAWRAWARDARGALDMVELSDAVARQLRAWPGLKATRRVLIYMPLADEINLTSLLETLPDTQFVTTRTPEQGGVLTLHEMGGPLEVHRFGFLQPHASAPEVAPEAIDLALVPGLAFDLWGSRLGRGAGYYDELLARMSRRLVRIGVVPAHLVVDRLPEEQHDQKMAFLATEEGVIQVASE